MRPGRRTAFVLCLLVLFGYEAYAIFVQEAGASYHEPTARELHRTREVNAQTALTQTFVMHANGLRAIDLFPRASDQPAIGPLVVSVHDLSGFSGGGPIALLKIDPGSIDLAGSLRIPFARVDHSGGHPFRVDIAMPQAPPGHGLCFEAGGPTYAQGEMTLGARPQWGDLKFRTVAERTTVFRNVRHLRQALPPLLRTDVFWIAALVAINWALATVVYYLGFAPETQG